MQFEVITEITDEYLCNIQNSINTPPKLSFV